MLNVLFFSQLYFSHEYCWLIRLTNDQNNKKLNKKKTPDLCNNLLPTHTIVCLLGLPGTRPTVAPDNFTAKPVNRRAAAAANNKLAPGQQQLWSRRSAAQTKHRKSAVVCAQDSPVTHPGFLMDTWLDTWRHVTRLWTSRWKARILWKLGDGRGADLPLNSVGCI